MKHLCSYLITEVLNLPQLFAHAIITEVDGDFFQVGEMIKIYMPFDFPVEKGDIIKVEIDDSQSYYTKI